MPLANIKQAKQPESTDPFSWESEQLAYLKALQDWIFELLRTQFPGEA